jgi:elongation factor P
MCFWLHIGKSIRPGATLVLDGIPHRVTRMNQGKRGKGGGFIRATLKNMKSLQVFEKTFTSDETVEHAELTREKAQYSWSDGGNFFFMNSVSFEEISVPSDDVDDKDFLVEGQEVTLLYFNDKIIGVDLPKMYDYMVEEIMDDGRARLDCGAIITVPTFLKAGTRVKVNVQDRAYSERSQS